MLVFYNINMFVHENAIVRFVSLCCSSVVANLQKFLRDDIYRRGGCRRSAALRGLKQVLPREANMKIISLRFAEREREQRNGRITHASAADRLS